MTKQEYNSKLDAIKKEFDYKRLELAKQFAFENNPYKVGDIIEDHIGKGVVRSWKVVIWETPELVYLCDNLTKSGKISKKEPTRYIHQSNIKS